MLRKIGQSYQVAIPRQVAKRLGLKVNDYLEVRVVDSKIVLEPQVLVPKEQVYFYTPEWQRDERKANEDIRKGRVTRTKNLKGLFKELDR